MTEPDKINLSFRYLGFRVLRYRYEEPAPENRRRRPGYFNFKIGLRPNPKQEKMFIRMLVDLRVGDPEGPVVATIETESAFKVLKLSSLVQDDDSIKLPEALITTLIGMHYSTTRGALVEKGAGTVVDKLILPVIALSELTPKDKAITLE